MQSEISNKQLHGLATQKTKSCHILSISNCCLAKDLVTWASNKDCLDAKQ